MASRLPFLRRNTDNVKNQYEINEIPRNDQNIAYQGVNQFDQPEQVQQHVQEQVKSTTWLKVKTFVVTIFAIATFGLAIAQSFKTFMTFGFVNNVTFNTKSSIITAVVSLYAALVAVAVKKGVTNIATLMTIISLNRNGKYFLKARTWSYIAIGEGSPMSKAPLFFAGLTVTAIVSMLPVRTITPDFFVNLNLQPNVSSILPTLDSAGIHYTPTTALQAAQILIGAFSTITNAYGYNSVFKIRIGNQVSDTSTMGYPSPLVNDRLGLATKYSLSQYDLYSQQSNFSACVYLLTNNPLQCTWLNGGSSGDNITLSSPYTGQTYTLTPGDTLTQPISDQSGNIQGAEIIVQVNSQVTAFNEQYSTIHQDYSNSNGFICYFDGNNPIFQSSTLTYTYDSINNLYNIAGNSQSNCEAVHTLPSISDISDIVVQIASAVFLFTGFKGENSLVDSFSNALYDINAYSGDSISGSFEGFPLLFADSTSFLQDGMGALVAIVLSQLYYVGDGLDSNSATSTTVYGGPLKTTIGLGTHSALHIWVIMIFIPITCLFMCIFSPSALVPKWDIINPIENLATEFYADNRIDISRRRTEQVRLGRRLGRVVATNDVNMATLSQ